MPISVIISASLHYDFFCFSNFFPLKPRWSKRFFIFTRQKDDVVPFFPLFAFFITHYSYIATPSIVPSSFYTIHKLFRLPFLTSPTKFEPTTIPFNLIRPFAELITPIS